MGNVVPMDSKLLSNYWVHVLAIMANSYLKIVFSQKSGLRVGVFSSRSLDLKLVG